MLTHGVVVLHDVPCEPGAVLAVARSLGYVRETNYGRLFDVRAEPAAANLAFTRLPIAPHTDNPYRDPVPTVQLLHCLHAAADGGGDSTFTDGFRAAAVLRRQDPAAFTCLTTTPVTFAYADAAAVLRATGPMIGLDPRGRIRQIRFNDRSLAPVRLPRRRPGRSTPPTAPSPSWPPARTRWSTATLAPGDCVIFDNTRILHGRTAFADGGGTGVRASRRHLQGCYADLDGLASTVAVLAREQAAPGRPGGPSGPGRAGRAGRPMTAHRPHPGDRRPVRQRGRRRVPGRAGDPGLAHAAGGRPGASSAARPRRWSRPPCCTTSATSPRRSPATT